MSWDPKWVHQEESYKLMEGREMLTVETSTGIRKEWLHLIKRKKKKNKETIKKKREEYHWEKEKQEAIMIAKIKKKCT